MRHEDDLRSALRTLELQTPDADAMLRRVTERTGARSAGRRLMTAAASAAAVVAIVGAAVAAPFWLGSHGNGPGHGQNPLASAPPYYMSLVPVRGATAAPQYAVVRSTTTGRTLATIRPPAPYITFVGVTGAADDRTFVLTARTALSPRTDTGDKLYEARFSPGGHTVSLTPLALPGLVPSHFFVGTALSPDGTQLAVAIGGNPIDSQHVGGFGWITIYSLPGGVVRTWTMGSGIPEMAFGSAIMTWSRAGLVFDWNGGIPGYFPGEYVLSTSSPGDSLLADSRLLTCGVAQSTSGNATGYLTPDATTIIVALGHPVAPGRSLLPCSQPLPPTAAVAPLLEEFSAATGKAIRVIYTGHRSATPNLAAQNGYNVFWSSDSGSVLVIDAPPAAGRLSVYGVLSRGVFKPIPSAPSVQGLALAF
jgi:hypothetical protein